MTKALPIKLHNSLAHAKYTMNTSEQKLFIYAIRNLNQNDRSFTESKFNILDFANYADLEITRLYKDIDGMIENIMQTLIHVQDDKRPDKWIKYNLTQKCVYNKGEIIFKFNNDMKPLLLELQQHYFFQSPSVVKFKSWYSIRLYDLLKSKSYADREVEISLDDFKTILGLEGKYEKLSNLKTRVIDVALKEINSSDSDIEFDYDNIYYGRNVAGFKFTVIRQDQQYIKYIDEVYNIVQIKEMAGLERECFNSIQILKLYEAAVENFTNHRNAEDIFLYMNINFIYSKDKNPSNIYSYYEKALKNDYAKAIPQVLTGYLIE